MRASLFREEALQHRQQPSEGTLLLAASPRSAVFSLLAAAAAICLLAYLFLGEFNRRTTVTGYLAPDKGLVKVFTQVTGTLLERRVDEGSAVRKGQILAVISTAHGSLQVRDANGEALRFLQEQLASLERELASYREMDALRKASMEDRRTTLEKESTELEAAIGTLEERLRKALVESGRFEDLQTSGFIASSELYRQEDISMDLRGRLQTLRRDRVALQGRQQALAAETAGGDLDSRVREESAKRRIAELKQRRAEYQTNDEIVVTAPADGIVTTILVQPGQQTRRDAPLLSIIPRGARLEARLLVPSHAIGFVTPGLAVSLRYAAFPYQRFGHHRGTVDSIARTLLSPGDAELPTPLASPAYLVTVGLEKQSVTAYGREFPLQAGMSFEGDVLLDRRSIIEWMFDPLMSLTKRS